MTPVQTDLLECVLCHVTDRDVAMGLIRHSEKGRIYFSTDPRCRDHDACLERMKKAITANLPWPLAPDGKA